MSTNTANFSVGFVGAAACGVLGVLISLDVLPGASHLRPLAWWLYFCCAMITLAALAAFVFSRYSSQPVQRLRSQPPVTPELQSRWRRKDAQDTLAGQDHGYTVVLVTNTAHTHDRHPAQVVYQGDNGHYWSLSLSEWPGNLVPE